MSFATNKKARFDYEILETFEAGIVLKGSEVKSIRGKDINLKGSFISVRENELILRNVHIGQYKPANKNNHDPIRNRKLLLHKKQILKLNVIEKEKGKTIMPLSIYPKGNLIKVQIGVGKGKKKHDKRSVLKDRDTKREAQREMRRSI